MANQEKPITKNRLSRDILFKGQYYHATELGKIHGLSFRLILERYKRGDRDDRLVRPPETKYIGSVARQKQFDARLKRGEVVLSSEDKPERLITKLTDEDKREFIEAFNMERESVEYEQIPLDMGEYSKEGGFKYYG